jgi:hypothetical protein
MNSNKYIFEIPKYHYATTSLIHPVLELYRLKLMDDLVKEIENLIDQKTKSKITTRTRQGSDGRRTIQKYFAQLLMNITTEKTYTTSKIINLDDGLFNLPTSSEINDFYRDLNYSLEKPVFQPDEFHLEKSIQDILSLIKKFANGLLDYPVDVYQFSNNKYTIRQSVLDEFDLSSILYLLDDLVIDQEITNKTKSKYTGPEDQYQMFLLCVLLRYKTFGSGANQFVVDISYKRLLRALGFNFECFASALNHYYDYYCSAFYDIEQYFGSFGSFMALQIKKGYYMANPPYDYNLLIKMYDKVKSALSSDDPVVFIMSIPKWKDFNLEKQIDQDHLYHERQIKYEYFLNPITKAKILIPPYISYLFYNQPLDQLPKLKHLFTTFTNYDPKHVRPILNTEEKKAYATHYLSLKKLKK